MVNEISFEQMPAVLWQLVGEMRAIRAKLEAKPIDPSPTVPTGYLGRKEVASRFQISLPTLNTYTSSGKVQGYRIGRRVLYKLAEIEAALSPIKTKKGGQK